MNPYESPKLTERRHGLRVSDVLDFMLFVGPSLLEFSLWSLLIAMVYFWPVCDWCVSSSLSLASDCQYCLQGEAVGLLVMLGAFQSIGRVVVEYRYYR